MNKTCKLFRKFQLLGEWVIILVFNECLTLDCILFTNSGIQKSPHYLGCITWQHLPSEDLDFFSPALDVICTPSGLLTLWAHWWIFCFSTSFIWKSMKRNRYGCRHQDLFFLLTFKCVLISACDIAALVTLKAVSSRKIWFNAKWKNLRRYPHF